MTLHNIPEGMAVGVIYAGLLSGAEHITEIGAFSLALGIAIQIFFQGSRASGGGVYCLGSKPYRSASAILFKFCGRGNVLCCSGRTYPGNVCWKTQQYWNGIIFLWVYTNADA